MTRVYADMVADLFHSGHVEFLRKAKALGDELVVGVHSDDDAAAYKRRPVLSMGERVTLVASCRYVDEVLPNAPIAVTRDWIERHRIDLVVHGDDFDAEHVAQYYSVPLEMGIFRTVPYTKGISTTEIIGRLSSPSD